MKQSKKLSATKLIAGMISATVIVSIGSTAPATELRTEVKSSGTPQVKPRTKPSTCYRVVVERHPTLCKQWAQNLNLFCDQPPMACDIKIHPSMSHLFSEPKWEALDPVKEFKWVEEVYRRFVRGSQLSAELGRKEIEDRNWKEMEDEVRRKAHGGRLRLSRAYFDPVNIPAYGRKWVYRVQDLDCRVDPQTNFRSPASPMFAVIDKSADDAEDKYGFMSAHLNRPILFEGGYVYWSQWANSERGEELLREPIGIRPLCEIKYEGVTK